MSKAPLPPERRRRVADALDRCSIACFGLLAGALLMTGATAAIAFPTMKALGPTLGAYPLYPGTHWNLAAGEVMRRVFAVADVVTLVCGVGGALLVAIAFALRTRLGSPMMRDWLRALLALSLLGVIAYQSISLRPAMNRELFAFIDAATLGDAPTADFHREQFSALHPTASRTLGTVFVLTFASLAAGVWGRRDG